MAIQSTSVADKQFTVIGIGGSTGAADAIKEMAQHLPSQTGMVYVYTHHQNPDYDGTLLQSLAQVSKLPVLEAEEGMAIEPDFIYMVPPGREMIVEEGYFKKASKGDTDYSFTPINRLFFSIAKTYNENAVGVLLSGSEDDGAQGLLEIKIAGGLTFAQNDTAPFKSMTKKAMAQGAVDLVLSPKEIAEELVILSQQKVKISSGLLDYNLDDMNGKDADLQTILQMVHKVSGVQFNAYKMSTIKRRIIRRVILHKLQTLNEYVQFIKSNSSEATKLFNDLLINVTTFFRDPDLSEYLKAHLLPEIIKNKKHNEPIRIWIPACSTGQEVYSMAILLIEVLGEQYTHLPLQIFATDLSEAAINKARLGLYSNEEIENINPKRLQRFFTKTDGGYRIIKSLRDICVFATHNIAKDPPFSKLDVISCCNLLIYLDVTLQKKIISTFHYSLNNTGYLILGKSETVGTSAHLFTQLDKKIKIFIKKKEATAKAMFVMNYQLPTGNKAAAANKLSSQIPEAKTEDNDLEKAVDSLLLKKYTPASVVIDANFDIVVFRGSTGLYLEPKPGKASLNLLKMARAGLGFELRNTIHKTIKTGEATKKTGLEISINGKVEHLNVEVIPLVTALEEPYYLVTFETIPTPPETDKSAVQDKRVNQLEAELAAMRDDMRSILESQEAAVEELQSANEEIVSSNEELQSINEELETSKEEIESSNEELITINQELQLRNEQLSETQEYAEVVFSTIRESLVILDKGLRVKMANFSFYKTFNLREEHTEGRLLYELNQKQWDIPKLRELLEQKLPENTYIHSFEIAHNFTGVGEKSLVINARRIVQKIHGEQLILLAIEDVTEHNRAIRMMADREIWFRNLADNAPVMIWVNDKDKKPTFFNKAWLDFRGDSMEEALQNGWTHGVHKEDEPKALTKFNESFAEKLPFELKYRVQNRNKQYVWLHNKAKPNFTPEGLFLGYIGSCVVINEVTAEG